MSMLLTAPSPAFNEKQGSGKYRPLRYRKKKEKTQEEKDNEFRYLRNTDLRMRFNNSQDPIYFVFDYLEQRSVPQLMGDFVKDSFWEISNFVSKVVS